MRLFIAINFDKETRKKILAVQERLRSCGKGNFSREENLHLTLAFLGEVEQDRLEDIKSVMNEIPVPEMELEFSELGFFRTGRNTDSQIWWLGIRENKTLSKLQELLLINLKGNGISVDDRRFKAHITLAREMHLKKWDKKDLMKGTFRTKSDHISLMLSERKDGKLVYTELYRK